MSEESIMARKGLPAATPKQTVRPAARRASKAAAQPVAVHAQQTDTLTEPAAAGLAPAKDTDTMQDTIKKTAAQAETLFAEINDRTKAAIEKNSKMFDEINDFAKGNVEAVVESSKIAAKGFENLGQNAAEYGRTSFEQASQAVKSFAAAKSPSDFFQLHSDYVRSAFDALVAETSKNTETLLKLAGEVAQPLSNRAAVAVEKVKLAA
jgi:phasin family protein